MEGQRPAVIVVDTNVLGYFLLPTIHTSVAETLWNKDSAWVSPMLIHSEFRNVVLGAVRRQDIQQEDALAMLDQALEAVDVPVDVVDGQGVLRLALDSGCSAYDCEFVWLARVLGVPLVTADRQVLESFPDSAVSMKTFLETGTRPGA